MSAPGVSAVAQGKREKERRDNGLEMLRNEDNDLAQKVEDREQEPDGDDCCMATGFPTGNTGRRTKQRWTRPCILA